MKLITPSTEYEESFMDFVRDTKETGYESYDLYRKAETDFGGFLSDLKDAAAGLNQTCGWPACSSFWLIDDEQVAGVIRIRHDVESPLQQKLGHIGYEIKSSERGRGLGSRLLQLGLSEAEKLGLDDVLITVHEDNAASMRLIEKFGGRFIQSFDDEDYGCPLRQYGLKSGSLRLEPFDADDIDELLLWLDGSGERFLYQFGGPRLRYPLDRAQMLAVIDDPDSLAFRAVDRLTGETAGHCELLRIDREAGTAAPGRLLVPPELRCGGVGSAMLRRLGFYAAHELGLKRLDLRVFAFNKAAVACYSRLGYKPAGKEDVLIEPLGESWPLIAMSLDISEPDKG